MILLILILCIIISYTHPWIDVFKDFRGVKHIVLWYTNYKGERKFINLSGDQQE
jgi:hypothetical protein